MMVKDDLQTDLPGIGDDLLEDLQRIQTLKIRILRVVDVVGIRHGHQVDVRPWDPDGVEPIGLERAQHRLIAFRIQTVQCRSGGAVGAAPADGVDADGIAAGVNDLAAAGT